MIWRVRGDAEIGPGREQGMDEEEGIVGRAAMESPVWERQRVRF